MIDANVWEEINVSGTFLNKESITHIENLFNNIEIKKNKEYELGI